jgi:FkbM family methyltransferase
MIKAIAASALRNFIKKDKTLDFKKFKFTVNYKDVGGRQYSGRSSYEELENSLYKYIADTLQPDLVIDVGANYGFTSLVFRQNFPGAKLILIEPSPKLHKYILMNLNQNGVDNYKVIKAVCGSQQSDSINFSLNPVSSQDNRVNGQSGWKNLELPSTTIADIIRTEGITKSTFIKIDTQGFESQVFDGAFDFLESSNQWFIKTEFAPYWLLSQGSQPRELLAKLVDKFLVVEAPARTRFCRDQPHKIFSEPIQAGEIEKFIRYVESLDRSQLGWVDLYVAPKTGRQWMNPTRLLN